MRKAFLACICAVAAMCLSCSEKKAEYTAGHAAKEYYDMLFAGDYAGFTDAMFFPDSIPESYRSQLVANAAMFAARQREVHNGVREVQILGCKTDTASSTAQAFLLFCYGDSLSEEVVVPMTRHNGKWLMR